MDTAFLDKTDEELAALVAGGTMDALGTLISRYKEKFFRYGRKFLSDTDSVEDIVQEIFIKTYQNIQSFDTEQKFSPWIYRIAHNEFVNALRKKSRLPYVLVNFDSFVSHPIYEDPTTSEREQQDLRKLLDKKLDALPPAYREVLVLHYFEDLSYKEVADVLHIPLGTVGIRLKRGRALLEQAYNEKKYE